MTISGIPSQWQQRDSPLQLKQSLKLTLQALTPANWRLRPGHQAPPNCVIPSPHLSSQDKRFLSIEGIRFVKRLDAWGTSKHVEYKVGNNTVFRDIGIYMSTSMS